MLTIKTETNALQFAINNGRIKTRNKYMLFPNTNKIHQDINARFGENAALLEEKMKQVNWRYFSKAYSIALGIFLASLFALIITVKFALWLF